jgi:hypothetical protein
VSLRRASRVDPAIADSQAPAGLDSRSGGGLWRSAVHLAGRHRGPLVVGSVAAGVRTLWVLIASRPPKGLADPHIYLVAGASIASGDGYTSLLGEPTAYYPPGYPLFVGVVHRMVDLIGANAHLVLTIGLVQALLGGVAAGSLVVAGSRLGRGSSLSGSIAGRSRGIAGHGEHPYWNTTGILAGLIVAFWPNLVLHSPLVLSESVFLSGFCVLLAALFVWSERDILGLPAATLARSMALPAVIVVSTAWCTLVRPQSTLLLIPAAVLAWTLAGFGWRRTLSGAALLVVGVLVVVGPWIVRNALVMDGFVPMSTNTGDNLCIGFHEGATGSFTLTEECATEFRYVDGPEFELARDAELRKRAWDWMLEHPEEIPRLAAAKLWATFAHDRDALAAWESFGADRHLRDGVRTTLGWVGDAYYLTAALLGVLGAALVGRDWWSVRGRVDSIHAARVLLFNRLLTVLTLLAGIALPMAFFGDQRFKVPVVPCIALLAAYFVVSFLREGRNDPDSLDQPR